VISVILPTYERVDAVLCALAALKNQTLQTFEIIVVDDSESNKIQTVIEEYTGEPVSFVDNIDPEEFGAAFEAVRKGSSRALPVIVSVDETRLQIVNRLRYIRSSPPRTGSFTAGRARNIGAANARGDLLVFIDQDVMLAPDALQHYINAYKRHGDEVVIVGLYHWLPRMGFALDDVRSDLLGIYLSAFGDDQKYTWLPMDEPGIQGLDMRQEDFGNIDHVVDDAALGAFSGNIGYPRKLFMALGGFDENIRGHGGEDADLGLTAKEHGARFLLFKDIWGLHRWHPRNQAQNAAEVQINIEYIDRKHGIGKYAGAHKWMDAQDWADPRHYHKDVGGVLMQAVGDPTVWVCRDGHRLGLPTPDWVERLGFVPGQVVATTPAGLNAYTDEGVAR
jgi:glycosyltransferase involved in cell wall biosynthesis